MPRKVFEFRNVLLLYLPHAGYRRQISLRKIAAFGTGICVSAKYSCVLCVMQFELTLSPTMYFILITFLETERAYIFCIDTHAGQIHI